MPDQSAETDRSPIFVFRGKMSIWEWVAVIDKEALEQ
jgi:hypothetical protein